MGWGIGYDHLIRLLVKKIALLNDNLYKYVSIVLIIVQKNKKI